MKKKSLFAFLLMLIMICSVSIFASAKWETDESGNTYFLKDDVKLTGGPHKISGKQYLFTKEGVLLKDTNTYYMGHPYVSKEDGSLLTTFGTYKGNIYYGTPDGFCKVGLQTYQNFLYYFNRKTGAAARKTFLTTANNKTYYFFSNGHAKKGGFLSLNGSSYYFNKKGVLAKTGFTKIGSSYYILAKKNGKVLTGSVKYGKYWYYLNPAAGKDYGKAFINKWKKIGGKEYYYGSNGRRRTGWLISGTKKYYLDPKKAGAKTYGKKKIGNVTYNFGTKGYVSMKLSGKKLTIRVNRAKCVVTAYDNGVPVKAMTCSTGAASSPTPCGTFVIQDHLAWWTLNGPSMGQYCSHFLPSYLFHSVPVYGTSRNPYGVNANDYNRLGSPASGGCIRLSVADAKWIYKNAPIGSTVIISDHEPTPLGKPATKKMKPNTKGADPTDDFHNPQGYDR